MSKDFRGRTTASFSRRKIPLLIQKCGFTHVKICIYTEIVMVYSHMKLTLRYFVFMLLYHIRSFTVKLNLCSYPVNVTG